MLEVREAAAMADRTPETIRRWVWSGRLAARKQGNRLLLAREDVTRLATPTVGSVAAGAGALSLADWWQETGALLGRGRRGVSAAELVCADRAERSGLDVGR